MSILFVACICTSTDCSSRIFQVENRTGMAIHTKWCEPSQLIFFLLPYLHLLMPTIPSTVSRPFSLQCRPMPCRADPRSPASQYPKEGSSPRNRGLFTAPLIAPCIERRHADSHSSFPLSTRHPTHRRALSSSQAEKRYTSIKRSCRKTSSSTAQERLA